MACVEVIEAAGGRVIMPAGHVCCGPPVGGQPAGQLLRAAGSWGFEAGKHGISLDCGEQALLPAVRQAGPDTLVVANGFSCTTQIADAGTGRRALHLAEVMQRARDGRPGPAQPLRPAPARRVARVAAAALPAAAALAIPTWRDGRAGS